MQAAHKHKACISRWVNGSLVAYSTDNKVWKVTNKPDWNNLDVNFKVVNQGDIVPMLKEKTQWLKTNIHIGYVPRMEVIQEIETLLSKI